MSAAAELAEGMGELEREMPALRATFSKVTVVPARSSSRSAWTALPGSARAAVVPRRRDGRGNWELVEILSKLSPVAVWSSPYRRAIQTVEPTAQALNLPVRTRWKLREWDAGLSYTDDWEPHYAHSWADPSYAALED
jgi:hypothetical protein